MTHTRFVQLDIDGMKIKWEFIDTRYWKYKKKTFSVVHKFRIRMRQIKLMNLLLEIGKKNSQYTFLDYGTTNKSTYMAKKNFTQLYWSGIE